MLLLNLQITHPEIRIIIETLIGRLIIEVALVLFDHFEHLELQLQELLLVVKQSLDQIHLDAFDLGINLLLIRLVLLLDAL